MPTFHRVVEQDDPSVIPTQSILGAKILIQTYTAVATVPPTLKYVTYATPFGTRPIISMTEAGSTSFRTTTGTYRADVIRNRPGSFGWAGTPSLKFRWQAFGI